MGWRTAIIGYGRSAAEMHAPYIDRLPAFTFSAVYDVSPEAAEAARHQYGCQVYPRYGDILAADLDLAVILTRNSMHAQMACEFLEAGKNVLITKPWAMDSKEARQIMHAAEKSGKLALPWLPGRWGVDLQALKGILSRGEIGKVFQVTRSHFTFGKRTDWQTLKEYGGGYLLNWGPHLVDQAMQLAGEPVASVCGEMKQLINPGTAEDMFQALLKTRSGVTLHVEFNLNTDRLPNWIVRGDQGTVYVTGKHVEIHRVTHPAVIDPRVYRSECHVETRSFELEGECFGDHEAIYRHIDAVLAGRADYAVTLDSAYGLTLVLDAIRSAAQEDRTVRLADGGS